MPKNQDRINKFSVVRDEASVRGILALIMIIIFAFFLLGSIILGGISVFSPLEGKVADAKEIIVTVSSIFSGPLGLILGYYFRTEVEIDGTKPKQK